MMIWLSATHEAAGVYPAGETGGEVSIKSENQLRHGQPVFARAALLFHATCIPR